MQTKYVAKCFKKVTQDTTTYVLASTYQNKYRYIHIIIIILIIFSYHTLKGDFLGPSCTCYAHACIATYIFI